MNKSFSKVITSILVLTMVMSMTACSGSKTSDNTNVTATPTDTISENTTVEEDVEAVDIPVEEGYFIYKNDKKTEIIGLTEDALTCAMDLMFPSTVTKISNVYLQPNSMVKTITFLNEDVILDNVSFSGSNVTTIVNLPNTLTEIPSNMFNGCSRLTTIGSVPNVITIPDTVTRINDGTFTNCASIKEVNFNKVTTIGEYAFQGCSSLEFINWGSVESIGTGAFFASGIVRLELSDSITSIGSVAFFRCENLTDININNADTIGQDIFRGCTSIKTFTSNADFTVVSSEENTDVDNLYSTLFDEDATVELHISKSTEYANYLDANPNANFTVVSN